MGRAAAHNAQTARGALRSGRVRFRFGTELVNLPAPFKPSKDDARGVPRIGIEGGPTRSRPGALRASLIRSRSIAIASTLKASLMASMPLSRILPWPRPARPKRGAQAGQAGSGGAGAKETLAALASPSSSRAEGDEESRTSMTSWVLDMNMV